MHPIKTSIVCILFATACASSKEIRLFADEILAYRNEYKKGFLNDSRSPLQQEDLTNIDFYKPDLSWKLHCSCQKVENSKPFEIPTYSGVTRTYIVHSKLSCIRSGKTINLEIYKNIQQPINPLYKNHLFLPFKDVTNGDETYGGGRYINAMDFDIVHDSITIDFNKSYNPWCAYSDGYNCPIPPKPNHIDIPVKAG